MTKELEKEAKEYAEENQIYVGEYCSYNHLVKAYLAGAEPREKQIQIDAEQIRALQKDKGELTDRVKELEAQVTRAFEVLEGKRKQIADLTEQNTSLLTSVENLNKSVQELEAQIEKMKCCENCQHWEGREPIPSLAEEGYYCFNDYPFECKRWELAEELKEIKENG